MLVLRMVKSMAGSITARGGVIGVFPGPWHAIREQGVHQHGKRGVRWSLPRVKQTPSALGSSAASRALVAVQQLSGIQ